jgi:hypothetical protein
LELYETAPRQLTILTHRSCFSIEPSTFALSNN